MKKLQIILYSLLLFLLSACHRSANEAVAPLVQDNAHIITAIFENNFVNTYKDSKYPYVITSVDSVNPRLLPLEADAYFDAIADTSKAFKKNGVLFYVSKNPSLVQVRVGNKLYFQSHWDEIITGAEYMTIQELSIYGDVRESLAQMVPYIDTSLANLKPLKWNRKFFNNKWNIALYKIVQKQAYPETSIYGNSLVYFYKGLALSQALCHQSWAILLVLSFILLLLKVSLTKLLKLIRFDNSTLKTVVYCLVLVPLIVGFGSSFQLLMSNRLEDQLLLSSYQLNLNFVSALHQQIFNRPIGLLYLAIALIYSVSVIFNSKAAYILLSRLSEKDQQAGFIRMQNYVPELANYLLTKIQADKTGNAFKAPFTAIALSFYQLFGSVLFWLVIVGISLPLSISIVALLLVSYPVLAGFISGIKTFWEYRVIPSLKVNQYYYVSVSLIAILFAVLIVVKGNAAMVALSQFMLAPFLLAFTLIHSIISISSVTIAWGVVIIFSAIGGYYIFKRIHVKQKAPYKILTRYFLVASALFFLGTVMHEDNLIQSPMSALYPEHFEAEKPPRFLVTANSLNLREEASTESKVVGQLKLSDTVLVIKALENDWCKVEFKQEKGYVSGKYLKELEE